MLLMLLQDYFFTSRGLRYQASSEYQASTNCCTTFVILLWVAFKLRMLRLLLLLAVHAILQTRTTLSVLRLMARLHTFELVQQKSLTSVHMSEVASVNTALHSNSHKSNSCCICRAHIASCPAIASHLSVAAYGCTCSEGPWTPGRSGSGTYTQQVCLRWSTVTLRALLFHLYMSHLPSVMYLHTCMNTLLYERCQKVHAITYDLCVI